MGRGDSSQLSCTDFSLCKWYRPWAAKFGRDYTEQGQLFEELTKESVEALYAGWKVQQTGWSRTHSLKLAAVVETVAACLSESKGNIEKWTKKTANEAGLDLSATMSLEMAEAASRRFSSSAQAVRTGTRSCIRRPEDLDENNRVPRTRSPAEGVLHSIRFPRR